MKRLVLLFLLIAIPASGGWYYGGGSAAPGSITLEDSAYLDENATDTDAVTAGEITVPVGSYNLLLVIVSFTPENNETISSVYWDTAGANEAFTDVNDGNYVTNDDAHSEAFYLINPTAGVNKAVTVNFSANLVYGSSIAVYALSGAAQSSPVRDFDGDAQQGASGCSLSVTLTVVAGDFIGMGSGVEEMATTDWTGSGFNTTTLFDENDTHMQYSSAYGTADGASELCDIDWSDCSANHMALVAVAIKVAS